MPTKILYAKTEGESLKGLEDQINKLEEDSTEFQVVGSVVDNDGYLE
jgi:hypothetical protein